MSELERSNAELGLQNDTLGADRNSIHKQLGHSREVVVQLRKEVCVLSSEKAVVVEKEKVGRLLKMIDTYSSCVCHLHCLHCIFTTACNGGIKVKFEATS